MRGRGKNGKPWLDVRAYMRRREARGLSWPSRWVVKEAIKDGRLAAAVVVVDGRAKIADPAVADAVLANLRPRRNPYNLAPRRNAYAHVARPRLSPGLNAARCHACGITIVERDRASHMTRCPGVPVVARKEPCP